MELAFVGRILQIILANVVLSGDNAVAIALAARHLQRRQQALAIALGGLGAIVLRIIFTGLAAYMLSVPLLEAVGGLVLAWIAFKLLEDESETGAQVHGSFSVVGALWIICVTDVTMSLDNVLAIAGLSGGDFGLLLFGLGTSMPIILLCSGIIAVLMNRLPFLAYVGSAILAWTAGDLIEQDGWIGAWITQAEQALESLVGLGDVPVAGLALPFAVMVVVLVAGWYHHRPRWLPAALEWAGSNRLRRRSRRD